MKAGITQAGDVGCVYPHKRARQDGNELQPGKLFLFLAGTIITLCCQYC